MYFSKKSFQKVWSEAFSMCWLLWERELCQVHIFEPLCLLKGCAEMQGLEKQDGDYRREQRGWHVSSCADDNLRVLECLDSGQLGWHVNGGQTHVPCQPMTGRRSPQWTINKQRKFVCEDLKHYAETTTGISGSTVHFLQMLQWQVLVRKENTVILLCKVTGVATQQAELFLHRRCRKANVLPWQQLWLFLASTIVPFIEIYRKGCICTPNIPERERAWQDLFSTVPSGQNVQFSWSAGTELRQGSVWWIPWLPLHLVIPSGPENQRARLQILWEKGFCVLEVCCFFWYTNHARQMKCERDR